MRILAAMVGIVVASGSDGGGALDCPGALQLLGAKGTSGGSMLELGASCHLAAPMLVALSEEVSPGRYRQLRLGACESATARVVAPDSVKTGVMGLQVNLRRVGERLVELRGRVGELNPPGGTGSLALGGTATMRAQVNRGEWSVVASPPDGGTPR